MLISQATTRDFGNICSSARIEVTHQVYATYKAGKPVQWFLGLWTKDELLAVLEHLYRKSGDRIWRSLAELTRSALAPTTRPLL